MSDTRSTLRQRLLQARQAWAGTDEAPPAQARLEAHLSAVLMELEPQCLGLYWPLRGEFNPRDVALALQQACGGPKSLRLALPRSHKGQGETAPFMDYAVWDGQEPAGRDDHGIPCADGPDVSPDVVIVPCVGFTAEGFRLGYGGGYFDRYMARHPHVTAIGVAWDAGRIGPDDGFTPSAHDQPLMAVVTPSGVVAG